MSETVGTNGPEPMLNAYERELSRIDERVRKLERDSDSRLIFTLEHHNAIMETRKDVKAILQSQKETSDRLEAAAARLDALERWRVAIMAICGFCGIVLGWIAGSGLIKHP